MELFSILTPFHIWSEEREEAFYRCLDSVQASRVGCYEHILIDDGSVYPYNKEAVQELPRTRWYEQPHLERVHGYNHAMEKATGEWFVILDSDDEILPETLAIYRDAIDLNPGVKMFNFAVKFASKAGPEHDWVRGPFEPEKNKVGHKMFGGGNIVNGSFIFHRSLYEEEGGFPEDCFNRRHKMHLGKNMRMTSPWDFSIRFQELYPEIKKLFQVTNPDHPLGYPRELGNPWGQDFALFYKYTRKHHSMPIDQVTHVIHPR